MDNESNQNNNTQSQQAPIEVQMFLVNIKMFKTNLNTLTSITKFCKEHKDIVPPFKPEELRKLMLDAYNTYNDYMVKASGKMLECIKNGMVDP